jgi:ABC-type glycerol-3-phosphate transport system permease component
MKTMMFAVLSFVGGVVTTVAIGFGLAWVSGDKGILSSAVSVSMLGGIAAAVQTVRVCNRKARAAKLARVSRSSS